MSGALASSSSPFASVARTLTRYAYPVHSPENVGANPGGRSIPNTNVASRPGSTTARRATSPAGDRLTTRSVPSRARSVPDHATVTRSTLTASNAHFATDILARPRTRSPLRAIHRNIRALALARRSSDPSLSPVSPSLLAIARAARSASSANASISTRTALAGMPRATRDRE